MKNERGITLVALIVTIVVLLILAGVSISLTLGNKGVINKTKEVKNQYSEAQTNDEKQLEETSDWIEEMETGIKKVDGVPIPKGYYYVGGTKEKGLVISDKKADEGVYNSENNVDVRRDLEGNQWVWVSAETPSELYTTVAEGVELSGNMEVKTTKYTNSAIISRKLRTKPGNIRGEREPDILTDQTYGDNDARAITAGFSSLQNMAETIVNEYDEMIRSLEKYKGFYIGRYELTANGEKTGITQTNKNWYVLYKSCTTLAKENSNIKTRMIWGLQWDVTCNWLENSGFYINDSSNWGNYSDNNENGHGEKQNTGFCENWKANNIYDFAGNCVEYTQEASFNAGRTGRGGVYFNSGFDQPVSYNDNGNPNGANFYGTRAVLYLIP